MSDTIFMDAWQCFNNGHNLIPAFREIHGKSYRQVIKKVLFDAHCQAKGNTHALVIIESPYAGAVQRNTAYLQMAIRDSVLRGESPYASHLMLTGALDDLSPTERDAGIKAGYAWAMVADKVAVYTDLGISDGMGEAIKRHKDMGRIVERRSLFQGDHNGL